MGKGSFHKIKDKEIFSQLLSKWWDTPVLVLKHIAERQISVASDQAQTLNNIYFLTKK
jgi:hypothetical protein